ncbi:MAG: hypothetical protein KIG95_11205, partial [Comamonas sp.]|nr:hypothetical protein [Comamonas sp.]
VQVSRVDLDARRIDFRPLDAIDEFDWPPLRRSAGRSRAARRTAALLAQAPGAQEDEGLFIPNSPRPNTGKKGGKPQHPSSHKAGKPSAAVTAKKAKRR